MKKEDCSQIGYIAKVHGYKGGVSIVADASFAQLFNNIEMFYLLIDEQLTPFFIADCSQKSKETYYVKLEGVDDEAAAKALLKFEVYIPLAEIPETEIDDDTHQYLIGYIVTEKNQGIIGEVEEVIDHDTNPLMIVEYQKREVLIPIQEDFILSIDEVKKELEMELPEGLLEL